MREVKTELWNKHIHVTKLFHAEDKKGRVQLKHFVPRSTKC